ncbi:MAG: hypothetical protein FJW66_01625 [Actinobacteria bacterium]|nr:hypothetical protein [Actinomycetota bacterium]
MGFMYFFSAFALFLRQRRVKMIDRFKRSFSLAGMADADIDSGGRTGQRGARDFLFFGRISRKTCSWLLRNGIKTDFMTFFMAVFVFLSALFIICLLFKSGIFIFFPSSALTIFLMYVTVDLKGRKVSKKKEDQMEGFMIELMGYLYTNPNLLTAIQKAAESSEAPLKDEFIAVIEDVRRGSRLNEALFNLLEKNRSRVIQVIITGLIAANEKGADLVAFLKDQIDYLREKKSIENYIRILSSGPRYTSFIIAAVPLAVVIIIALINRDFVSGMLQGTGLYVFIYAILSYATGFFVINRIINAGFRSDSSIS